MSTTNNIIYDESFLSKLKTNLKLFLDEQKEILEGKEEELKSNVSFDQIYRELKKIINDWRPYFYLET